jgi:hypothetical protein
MSTQVQKAHLQGTSARLCLAISPVFNTPACDGFDENWASALHDPHQRVGDLEDV